MLFYFGCILLALFTPVSTAQAAMRFTFVLNVSAAITPVTPSMFSSWIASAVNMSSSERVVVTSNATDREVPWNKTDTVKFEFAPSANTSEETPVRLSSKMIAVLQQGGSSMAFNEYIVPMNLVSATWDMVATPAPGFGGPTTTSPPQTTTPRPTYNVTNNPYQYEDNKNTLYAVVLGLVFGMCAISGIAWVGKRISLGDAEPEKKPQDKYAQNPQI